MSVVVNRAETPTVELTAAEREWIRRQGVTARALAEEQRRMRERLSSTGAELRRVREQYQRDQRRFSRS
jgi:hypothetical protein